MSKIDFVIPWVDSSDPEWQREKNQYNTAADFNSDGDVRYRDWELLKYWFRGAEKFAPWVNKVHFITWGHVPEWLNTNHPKLNIVRHEDFIPSEYLPTFSSHVIELNMHRIKDLAEQFVYFNDDVFLINHTEKEHFFRNGLPCDEGLFNYIFHNDNKSDFPHILLTMVGVMNQNFNFKEQIKLYEDKFINEVYENFLYINQFYRQFNLLPGFYTIHLSQAFLKSTFEEVWNYERELLENVSKNKFRQVKDVNQYLMRYWQLMTGRFEPTLYRKNGWVFYSPEKDSEAIETFIREQTRSIICINDSVDIDNFEEVKQRIDLAFSSIMPKRSSFELQ